jgi:hypothetical protein
MVNMGKSLILTLFSVAIVVTAGCSGASAVISQPAVQEAGKQSSAQLLLQNNTVVTPPKNQPGVQQSPQVDAPQNSASVTSPAKIPAQTPPVLSNRIDVIYFHMDTQCSSCLCFEKQITDLMTKYFQSDIQSGKLTFRVLNAQNQQNTAIVRKYGAVGSQLFINDVVNDYDNIENIEDIWSWDCLNNPSSFDLNVKGVIERYLSGNR